MALMERHATRPGNVGVQFLPPGVAAASAEKDETQLNAAFAAPVGGPLIDLDGTSRPVPPLPAGVPRIAARAVLVPVT